MSKPCLILIDLQKGVVALKNGVFNADAIIKHSVICLKHAINKGIQVILTQHENNSFLIKHSENWELMESVKKYSSNAFILEKKHPGIYKESGLEEYLQQINTSDLYIGGLISNGCVREACIDSLKHGFPVHLLEDCHSTFYGNAKKVITDINSELEKAGIDLISTLSFIEKNA
ncbi:MAG: cysteine hydrolase [Spirochaetales bacterium]|nr:cysteine hydrolase [Spirochaetales bacterium]